MVRLRLVSSGLELSTEWPPIVKLPWDAYGEIGSPLDGPPRDAWCITPWYTTQLGSGGIAVHVSGRFEHASSGLPRDESLNPTLRLDHHRVTAMLMGRSVPLVTSPELPAGRERDTLEALIEVLSRRPELRARLDDRACIDLLAVDLTFGLQIRPIVDTGERRDSVDMHTALRVAGLVHPFGRPLQPHALAPLDEVIASARAALEANPYRAGRTTNDARLERIVRREYYDVAPWPFRALLIEPARPASTAG